MATHALSVVCVFAFAVVLAAAAPASFASVARQAAGSECYPGCAFTFCPFQASITPGTPDRALSGAICSRDPTVIVGHVDETGEAQVAGAGGAAPVPISQYSPAGLRQKFPPSFWKSYGLPIADGRTTDLSGVGHETPQQNQVDFLAGQCFILPLREYQVLNRVGGSVIANVRPTNPLVQCVAFSVGAVSPAAAAGNVGSAAGNVSSPPENKSDAAMQAAAPFLSGSATPTEAPNASAVSDNSAAPSATGGPLPEASSLPQSTGGANDTAPLAIGGLPNVTIMPNATTTPNATIFPNATVMPDATVTPLPSSGSTNTTTITDNGSDANSMGNSTKSESTPAAYPSSSAAKDLPPSWNAGGIPPSG